MKGTGKISLWTDGQSAWLRDSVKAVGSDYWTIGCGAIAVGFAGHLSSLGGDGKRVLTCADMLLDARRMGDGEVS